MPHQLGSVGVRSSFDSILGWVYNFHMPLFFMIPGYAEGIATHSGGLSRRLLKNFVSLYVPCLLFSYSQAVLNLLVFSSSNSVNARIPELRNFLMIPFSGFLNYWFLCSLFFVKTLHLLFESFVRNKYLHASFWIIVFILAGISEFSLLRIVACCSAH